MAYSKLSRDASSRKALFRDLVTDLFLYERIQTTEAKAKELRPIAEKLITLAKRGDLHARRQVAAFVRRESLVAGEQDAIQKLFSDLATSLLGTSGRIHAYFETRTSSRRRGTYGLLGTG